MSLDLNIIRVRAEQYANAIGPGGEKAWLAGLLAADVPKLLAEVEQLQAALAAVEQDRDRLRAAMETIRNVSSELPPDEQADFRAFTRSVNHIARNALAAAPSGTEES